MIDKEVVVSYEEEIEVNIKNDVVLRKKGEVWSACFWDEDELILEDPKEKVFFTESVLFHNVTITPEILEEVKTIVEEDNDE